MMDVKAERGMFAAVKRGGKWTPCVVADVVDGLALTFERHGRLVDIDPSSDWYVDSKRLIRDPPGTLRNLRTSYEFFSELTAAAGAFAEPAL